MAWSSRWNSRVVALCSLGRVPGRVRRTRSADSGWNGYYTDTFQGVRLGASTFISGASPSNEERLHALVSTFLQTFARPSM